jgi:hypothetical protein
MLQIKIIQDFVLSKKILVDKIGDTKFVFIISLCFSKEIFSNLSKYHTQAFSIK